MKISLNEIVKIYKEKNNKDITALDHISLRIEKGEKIIIVGESGAGKTTLLNIIALLNNNFSGDYVYEDHQVKALKQKEISRLRNEDFGYVFQDYMLVEGDSVYENVEIPLYYSRKYQRSQRSARIYEVLEKVELGDLAMKNVSHLSGGQRQRVAIARAMVNNPDTLILDEPTGALNREMSNAIMKYVYDYVDEQGKTMIMVTHDVDKVKFGTCRILEIQAGRIVADFMA